MESSSENAASDRRELCATAGSLISNAVDHLLSALPRRGASPIARRVQFTDVHFRDAVDLSDLRVIGDATFVRCTFDQPVDFNGWRVFGTTTFDHCNFHSTSSWDDARFSNDLRFYECRFEGESSFDRAVCLGRADFVRHFGTDRVSVRGDGESPKTLGMPQRSVGCNFSKAASFDSTRFRSGVSMRRCVFEGPASYANAHFGASSDWIDADFHGTVDFKGIRSQENFILIGTSFHLEKVGHANLLTRSPVDFSGGKFYGEVNISGTFRGHAGFSHCQFHEDAAFTDSQFLSAAQFYGSNFSSNAGFHMATFSSADFAHATFGADCTMTQTRFGEHTRFFGAEFSGTFDASRSEFLGAPNFDTCHFQEDVNFKLTRWMGQPSFIGTAFTGTFACFDRAVFDHYLDLGLSTSRATFTSTQFGSGARVVLAPSSCIAIENADIRSPLLLTSNGELGPPPQLMSLRGSNAAAVVIEDVSVESCLFSGAHGLDGLKVHGELQLKSVPRGIRSPRTIVIEEVLLRQNSAPWRKRDWLEYDTGVANWIVPPSGLTHAKVASVYRGLRKAREDSKDEPGAADMYYGEMEMRRLDPTRGRAERTVLSLYWLTSGYALRASRALLLLIAMLALATIVIAGWGLEPAQISVTKFDRTSAGPGFVSSQVDAPRQPSSSEKLLVAAKVSLDSGTSLLRSSAHPLTLVGTLVSVLLRLAGPILLGLALLSLRGRVKR